MTKRASPLDRFARDLAPGTLSWIGVRSERRGEVISVKQVRAIASHGLRGDHRMEKTPGSARQVTLISEEFIDQIEHFTGHEAIDPALLRRNLVVRGINLNALRHQRFQIGDALFEATALCHPCSRMETALGKGGVAAMIGHGGLCARILTSGEIAVGDVVEVRPEGENLALF
ncbi:MOSC domain-containing protein [Halieaceae bacterium IMCC14734]|uniref:MOSC domain-containing protein n=1 Tax=Candidatus Litorirhabdus singularis TaxID=2518993 RepID=A0ABT3TDS0_9GAMM|nr:MOSC domain-containing protein [Candidatus Litorirhabdus singularis]MCX2980458.1 MOSC domain-containing protein [Candidatus Litorirhabdus singularis]